MDPLVLSSPSGSMATIKNIASGMQILAHGKISCCLPLVRAASVLRFPSSLSNCPCSSRSTYSVSSLSSISSSSVFANEFRIRGVSTTGKNCRRVSQSAGIAAASLDNGKDGGGNSDEYDFDLFTIGAGSGGVRASRFASQYGAKVAVCELPFSTISSEKAGGVGGTCVIRGCVPKKLLVYASEYTHAFDTSAGFGWTYPAAPVHDWPTLISNKNKELQRLTGAYKNTLEKANVRLIEGRGKVTGPHTVDVDGQTYTARHILVAVGGRAFVPPMPGTEHVITSDEALELPERPKKIAIVGGGYIALEFACIFHGLGSEVHVVIRQPRPLRGFDEEVREFLFDQMKAQGIIFHMETNPTAVEKEGEGSGNLTLVTDKSRIEGADAVMFATGRKANTKNLGRAGT
eukprot:TRINITY_DN26285_c0_g1_i2.p1 TRINITY_DN26285_c0_g1~~TRINITY_DN26285_c0_g1_i2.p1  ORF type:complete len:411 (+),score=67.41 TRINITY_DN26285_c0_g1_i2:26-1234(+)